MRVVRFGALWLVGLSLACSGSNPAGTAQTGPSGVLTAAQPAPAVSAAGGPSAPRAMVPAMPSPAAVAAMPAGSPPAASPSQPIAMPAKPENAAPTGASGGTSGGAMTPGAAIAGAAAEAASPAPAAGAGTAAAAPLPRMGFAAFATTDLDASLDFYKTVFKMTELMRIPLGTGMEVVLGYKDLPTQAGLVIMSTPGQTAPLEHGNAFSRFIFVVEDINATVKQFQDRDLQVVSAPAAGNGFMYSIVVAPDGYRIELIQYD